MWPGCSWCGSCRPLRWRSRTSCLTAWSRVRRGRTWRQRRSAGSLGWCSGQHWRSCGRLGWLAVISGLVGQAMLAYVAILLVPGITASFWSAFWASWIVAGVSSATAWLASAGTDDSFVASLLRRKVAHEPLVDPEVDGVVFVQLDGVAFPVLRWAIQAGGVPTLRRWVTSGDYVLREWTAQLPCTTPASQLGILHGTIAGVPAFRWYDRELGRVLIANRPDDAAVIEQRATTGTGCWPTAGWGWGTCSAVTRQGRFSR